MHSLSLQLKKDNYVCRHILWQGTEILSCTFICHQHKAGENVLLLVACNGEAEEEQQQQNQLDFSVCEFQMAWE